MCIVIRCKLCLNWIKWNFFTWIGFEEKKIKTNLVFACLLKPHRASSVYLKKNKQEDDDVMSGKTPTF